MELNNDFRKQRRKPLDLGNMVYGKVPPQARDVEEAILGALMLDSSCLATGVSKLFPELFYVEAHQRIYKAIQDLYDKSHPIDLLTVVEQLKKNEALDLVGGMYYVTKMTNQVVSGANIENHILLITELYAKREMIRISGETIGEAYEEDTDAFDLIGKADDQIQKTQERILAGISRDVAFFGMRVLEQHAHVKETGVLGDSTGIKVIDDAICGLVPPDLIIIAARPGQGKTALALSVTYNTTVKNNIPCAWFSLEMDGVQLVRRLASIDTKISHERIRTGKTSESEDKLLGESVDRISSCPLHIEDKTSMNVRDIRTRASLLKKKYKIKYIVVDYIQLMTGTETKGKNREQVVSEISRSLKVIAKELEIPVIALSQLSREVEKRPDKMPQLSDLRESGAIEQDADTVMFLMRPEYYKMTEDVTIGGEEYSVRDLCVCAIEKNRHGKPKTIAMKFEGAIMHFSDVAKDSGFTPHYQNYIEPEKKEDLPF
jgi:replicative DNA helicase